MTMEDLQYCIAIKKELEFNYQGLSYTLNYDKDSDGHEYIVFGRTFEGKKYSSYGEFINNAKIDNHYFREMLDIFDIK